MNLKELPKNVRRTYTCSGTEHTPHRNKKTKKKETHLSCVATDHDSGDRGELCVYCLFHRFDKVREDSDDLVCHLYLEGVGGFVSL